MVTEKELECSLLDFIKLIGVELSTKVSDQWAVIKM